MARPPLPDAEKPDQRDWKSDDRHRDRKADGDDQIRFDQRVEFGVQRQVVSVLGIHCWRSGRSAMRDCAANVAGHAGIATAGKIAR